MLIGWLIPPDICMCLPPCLATTDEEPPPPPGSSPEVIESYRQRRLLRRAGRGPQYGDAMIGPVEELVLRENSQTTQTQAANMRKTRLAQMQQAK